MSARFNLVVIRCRDLTVSERFYTALGLTFEPERHGKGPQHLSCAVSGVVFELYPASEGAPKPTERLGFEVEVLEETLAALQNAGGAIKNAPKRSSWGLRAVVLDPDGRAIELLQVP